ncbi:alpha/beta hydrolase [Sphingomicrobium nitratireducens]|uniref:alpha/beta hydrolase n=1 Tax=Sphingomicrobium nitratireducens TaxID=2964666 RepID=UPI00223F9C85|nr:alpha/beta hydrolase [Sphingomicrobium nitratireducens]
MKRRVKRMRRRVGAAGEASLWALERVGLSPVALLDTTSRFLGDKDTHCLAAGKQYGNEPRQSLDIWAPRQVDGPLPVVVFFYGGGWVGGERGEFGYVGRALAAQGFLAVLPDYRLAPSAKFPDFIEDGALAVKWLIDHAEEYGGDPARIAVAGHSAGGHLAAMLTLNRRYLGELGLDPGVVGAAVLMSAPTHFLPFKDPRAIAAFGHWPEPLETQPIRFARGDAPPILIQTGTADITVRARNSQQLAHAIEKEGGDVTLKLYRGAVHSDPVKSFSPLFRTKYPFVEDMIAFLKDKLA